MGKQKIIIENGDKPFEALVYDNIAAVIKYKDADECARSVATVVKSIGKPVKAVIENVAGSYRKESVLIFDPDQ